MSDTNTAKLPLRRKKREKKTVSRGFINYGRYVCTRGLNSSGSLFKVESDPLQTSMPIA